MNRRNLYMVFETAAWPKCSYLELQNIKCSQFRDDFKKLHKTGIKHFSNKFILW